MFWKTKNRLSGWVTVTLMGFLACGVLGCSASAQEKGTKEESSKTAEKKAESKDGPEASDEKQDPFALPEKPDKEALIAFLDDVNSVANDANSQAEAIAFEKKRMNAILQATKLGLDLKDLAPEETLRFLAARTQTLVVLEMRLGEKKKLQEALALTKKYSTDKNEQVASVAKNYMMQLKMLLLPTLSKKERDEVVTEVMEGPEKDGLNRFNFRPVMSLAQALEEAVEPKEAAAFYRRVAKLCEKSDNEQIAGMAEKMLGTARRLELPGNKMELFGTTVAGDKFKWEDYRGKVVLVDFWATWCGPCVAELPNVKANYEKYHSKGFEVVGVNLDNDKERLEEFTKENEIPWVNLFPEDENVRGWDNPMAAYYGITSIPTVILVDQEGKVVSLGARGPELGRLLGKLLGAPASE